jgi:regulator of replication initiation timing
MATTEEVEAMKKQSITICEDKEENISDILEELNRLKLENEEYKKRQQAVYFTVNEKGAVAVHGLGKYPVALYKVQWEKILAQQENLRNFINENLHNLK